MATRPTRTMLGSCVTVLSLIALVGTSAADQPPNDLPACPSNSEVPDTAPLLQRVEQSLEGSSSVGTMTMAIKTPKWSRTLKMKVWSKGRDHALVRVLDGGPREIGMMTLKRYHDLDLLALKLSTSHVDVTVGRQVLSWGSGRLWNPTDLLSPFAPTDVDREVRRGVDAVRVSLPLAATAQLEVLWLPLPELRDNGGVVRAQVNVRGFDVAPSAAKYVRDAVFGLDVTGDVGTVGIHGEAAWTVALDRDDQARRDQFLRVVAGADVRPTDDLVLSTEYYENGWGAADPAGYLGVLRSARIARGEVFGAGRHYLGLTGSWMASGLLTLRGAAITNLSDPSLLIVPSLEYSVEQNVLVRAGCYLPLGRRPDLDHATDSLALRSEYGASPLGAFAQIAIYLL